MMPATMARLEPPPPLSSSSPAVVGDEGPATTSTSSSGPVPPTPEQAPSTPLTATATVTRIPDGTTPTTTTTVDLAPPSQSASGSRHSGVLCLQNDDDADDAACCCWWWWFPSRNSKQSSFPCTVALQFCTSLVTLVIGVSLLLVSQHRHPTTTESSADPLLSRSETQAYWLRLRNHVLQQVHGGGTALGDGTNASFLANGTTATSSSAAADTALWFTPGSPMWHASQWMVLDDPLRQSLFHTIMDNEETWDDHHHVVLQRFTLATLYFEWSGPHWVLLPRDGWLSATSRHALKPHHTSNSWTTTTTTTTPMTTQPEQPQESQEESPQVLAAPEHECDWVGIGCNEHQQVTSLALNRDDSGVSIVGTLPSILSALHHLQELGLAGHALQGSIPSEWAHLPALTSLDVSFNRLSHVDFGTVGQWTGLKRLDLSSNWLQKAVPWNPTTGNYNNVSKGALDQLVHLEHLDLSSNEHLVGNAFRLLAHWPQLAVFQVGGTSCTGSLPDTLTHLTHLTTLSAGFSQFQGTIPTSIGACTTLQALNLGGSDDDASSGLVGTIPTELGNLADLSFLSLSTNRLQSTIPTELGRLTRLQVLDLQFLTGLHGTIPTELARLSNSLLGLYLQGSAVTGSLPSEFVQLTQLQTLNVVGTQLNRSISNEFCALESLQDVRATCTPETCSCCMCGSG